VLASLVWILVYIITGAVVLTAGVFAAAWFVAREVNAGHEPSCVCPSCQRKRQRQWQRNNPTNQPSASQQWKKDRKPPQPRSLWVSTLELTPGRKVIGRETGSIYRVESVEPVSFGFMVVITNVVTGNESHIPIARDEAHHRIWLVRDPKRREP
jgi:hypothetical protein